MTMMATCEDQRKGPSAPNSGSFDLCDCTRKTPDLADVRRSDAGALGLAEGHVQGKLDGQAGHRPGGQGFDLGHSLNQAGFGAVRLQGHLQWQNSK